MDDRAPKNYEEFCLLFKALADVKDLGDVPAQDVESHILELKKANLVGKPYWTRRVRNDIRARWVEMQNDSVVDAGEDSDVEEEVTEERIEISSSDEEEEEASLVVFEVPIIINDEPQDKPAEDDEFADAPVPDAPSDVPFCDPVRLMQKGEKLLTFVDRYLTDGHVSSLENAVFEMRMASVDVRSLSWKVDSWFGIFAFGGLVGFSTIIGLLAYIAFWK